MSRVKINPKTKRARNRVNEHGEVMELVKRGEFQGKDAVLVVSIGDTWRGQKWMGWFTSEEATVEEVEDIDPTPIYPWGNSPPRGNYVGD